MPECEKALGRKTTEFTEQWLSDKLIVTVSNVRTGVYAGCVIGEISHKGESLRDALFESGNVRDYVAKVKDREPWSWCE